MIKTQNVENFLTINQTLFNEDFQSLITEQTLKNKLSEGKCLEMKNDTTQEVEEKDVLVSIENGSLTSIINATIPLHDDEDEPFFLMDVARIVQKYDQWMKLLPNVEPHYAVKCNSDLVVLETLARLGCKFDCASKGEIEMVMKFGMQGKDIIFANPCKPKGHLNYAKKHGVKQMTFDNLKELQKIRDVYPDAELFLRIGVDDSGAICQLSSKFGANLSLCPKLLSEAKLMGLNVVGLSFHVGSGQQTVEAYIDALDRARSVFDMAESLGVKLSVLDIGGGFPGDDDDEVFFGFEQVALAISKKINETFPDVRVIAEPGRYFVAACCTLVTKVYAVREQTEEDKTNYFYYINDGVYGSFNNLIYDHATLTPSFLRDTSEDQLYRSTVFGPSCDGLDTLLKNYPLPRLNTDEWIFWRNMGAYTICASASFNGFPLPKIHYFWITTNTLLISYMFHKYRFT
jgi:ornithine decarboxylase